MNSARLFAFQKLNTYPSVDELRVRSGEEFDFLSHKPATQSEAEVHGHHIKVSVNNWIWK